MDIPRVYRSTKYFPTGSKYKGTWDILGMSGYGVYTFPNGVIYEGEFEDGMFHGIGKLQYPNGCKLKGRFNKGIMTDRKLIFDDGLEYEEHDWQYCKMPDRRYTIEYKKGLQPAGKSNMTARLPSRKIPPGFYDTGDGFYDPVTKIVYNADDLTAILRSPSVREQKWIMENCRTTEDNIVGPRPDLYEQWLEPQMKLPPVPPPAATTRFHQVPKSSFYEIDNQDKNFYNINSKASKEIAEASSNVSLDILRSKMQSNGYDFKIGQTMSQHTDLETPEIKYHKHDNKRLRMISFDSPDDAVSLTSYELKMQASSRFGITSSVMTFSSVEHTRDIESSKKSRRFIKNLISLHPPTAVPFEPL